MSKIENKTENFKKAVKRLNEAVTVYKNNPEEDIYQDAVIKRFEFTYELAWKTLREYMIDEGYSMPSASPKGVIAYAYQEGILPDESLWLSMIEARNNSAHVYAQELAAEIAEEIAKSYAKELTRLSRQLSGQK